MSGGLFCEQLDYNLLFRWFLDMGFEDASFDHSTFSQNRERLLFHIDLLGVAGLAPDRAELVHQLRPPL